jgi:putative peptidoglycan lipid II flippase
MNKARLARAAGIVASLTIVSKLLGFLRETSLAAVFGATADVDAFLVAQTIPSFLFSIVSYSLTTTFVPMYSQARENKGSEAAFRFASTVMWAVLAVGVLFVAIGEVLAGPLARVVAPGFSGDIARLTTYLSRIIFPMMVFQLLSGIMTGILQVAGEFAVSSAVGLVQNVVLILSILIFGPRSGIVSVAVGLLIGTVLATLAKIPAILRTGFRWGFVFDLRDRSLQRMLVLMLPAVIGAGAGQINTLIDRILASGLPEGRIAALNYANRLMALAPGIIGTSIVTVVYPTLAEVAARKEWRKFGDGLASSLGLMHLLLAPCAVGVLVLREPIVRVVLERGAFDAAATQETAWALLFLSLGIAITSMRLLVNRAFFALQDTKTPMILGLVTIGANIVLNLLLVGPLEQGGLALATTAAAAVGLVLGLWLFKKKGTAPLPGWRLLGSVFRSALASGIMGMVVWFAYPSIERVLVQPSKLVGLLRLCVSAAIGAIVYGVLVWLLRVPELAMVADGVRKGLEKLRRRGAQKNSADVRSG